MRGLQSKTTTFKRFPATICSPFLGVNRQVAEAPCYWRSTCSRRCLSNAPPTPSPHPDWTRKMGCCAWSWTLRSDSCACTSIHTSVSTKQNLIGWHKCQSAKTSAHPNRQYYWLLCCQSNLQTRPGPEPNRENGEAAAACPLFKERNMIGPERKLMRLHSPWKTHRRSWLYLHSVNQSRGRV